MLQTASGAISSQTVRPGNGKEPLRRTGTPAFLSFADPVLPRRRGTRCRASCRRSTSDAEWRRPSGRGSSISGGVSCSSRNGGMGCAGSPGSAADAADRFRGGIVKPGPARLPGSWRTPGQRAGVVVRASAGPLPDPSMPPAGLSSGSVGWSICGRRVRGLREQLRKSTG